MRFGDEPPIKHGILIDFNLMKIDNNNNEKLIEEFYAIEAVDTAELRYLILQPDVTAIMHKKELKI